MRGKCWENEKLFRNNHQLPQSTTQSWGGRPGGWTAVPRSSSTRRTRVIKLNKNYFFKILFIVAIITNTNFEVTQNNREVFPNSEDCKFWLHLEYQKNSDSKSLIIGSNQQSLVNNSQLASDTLLLADYSLRCVQPHFVTEAHYVSQTVPCLVQPCQTPSQLQEFTFKPSLANAVYGDSFSFAEQFCDESSVHSTRVDAVRFSRVSAYQ